MKTFLAIDPSVRCIGWATFTGDPLAVSKNLNDVEWSYGAFIPGTRAKLYNTIRFDFISNFPKIDRLIIETPTFHNSEKGRIAAKEGYTTQLGIIAGYIMGLTRLSQEKIFLYPPIVWKGNVPKEVTLAMLKRKFNKSDWILNSLTHDTIDAIGLLRFHLTTEYHWA